MLLQEEVNKIIYDRSKNKIFFTEQDIEKIIYLSHQHYSCKHKKIKVNFSNEDLTIARTSISKPLVTFSFPSFLTRLIKNSTTHHQYKEHLHSCGNTFLTHVILHEITHLEHFKITEQNKNNFNTNYLNLVYFGLYEQSNIKYKLKYQTLTTEEQSKLRDKKNKWEREYENNYEVSLVENITNFDAYLKLIDLLLPEVKNLHSLEYIKTQFLTSIKKQYKHGSYPYEKANNTYLFKEIEQRRPDILENIDTSTTTVHEKLRYGFQLPFPAKKITESMLIKK